MADVKGQCFLTFKHFVESAAANPNLTETDLRYITDKGITKLLKECINDAASKASEVSVFPKYCDKKTKKLEFDAFFGDYMLELAAVLIQNKKKLTKRPELSDAEVVTMADGLREQIAAKHNLKTKAAPVDATTARLTDTSKYTGTHKERFDESGKGKGMAGREDLVSTSGYVQGYKNEGAYDKK